MRYNSAIGFVIQVRMRSSDNVSLNQLFIRCYGVLGSAIHNWVWYMRIGGGMCSRPGHQSPGGIKNGLQKKYIKLRKRKLVFCSQKNFKFFRKLKGNSTFDCDYF